MDFNARVVALTAEGFTFTITKRRGSLLRLAFGEHACGVVAEVHETTGAAFFRVSK